MDALLYCIHAIRREIPEPIINAAMTLDEPEGLEEYPSVDELLMSKVVRPIVMTDLDLLSQREVVIPLTGLSYKLDYYNNMIWKIPEDRRQGAEIVSALGIGISMLSPHDMYNHGVGLNDAFALGGSLRGSQGCFKGNALTEASDQMRATYERPSIAYNTKISMIGPNTVLLKGNTFLMSSNLVLRCKLANDARLNNINPRSYSVIGEATVLAFKAFAYRTLYLTLDGGLLQFGQEFGRFDQLVESYESAMEDYKEFIKMRVGKVLAMNDEETYDKFLMTMTDPFA